MDKGSKVAAESNESVDHSTVWVLTIDGFFEKETWIFENS